MNKPSRLFLVLCWALTGAAIAQSPNTDKPPAPPFVAPMPDNSIWTITVTNPGASPNATVGGRVVNQFINTKSGSTRKVISIWSDSTRSEIWFWRGYRLEQNPGSSAILVTKIANGHDYQDVDFIDLDWLGTSNYVGVEDQNGHSCYHFKTQVKMAVQNLIVDYSAYMDVKTKRPVAWDSGPNHFELSSFALRKPDEPLVLPEAYTVQLKAYLVAAQAANPYKKQ